MNDRTVKKLVKQYKRAQDIKTYISIMKQRKKDQQRSTAAAQKGGSR